MQEIQAKVQHAQEKVAQIIPALLKFGSSLWLWRSLIWQFIVINQRFLRYIRSGKKPNYAPTTEAFLGFFHAGSLHQHLERCLECSTINAHRTIHQMTFLPKMKRCIQIEEVLGSRHTIKTNRPNMGSIYQA